MGIKPTESYFSILVQSPVFKVPLLLYCSQSIFSDNKKEQRFAQADKMGSFICPDVVSCPQSVGGGQRSSSAVASQRRRLPSILHRQWHYFIFPAGH